MSLINQMLNDLDQRQAGTNNVEQDSDVNNDANTPPLAAIFPVNSKKKKPPYFKIFFSVLIVSLLSATTYFSYLIYQQQPKVVPQQNIAKKPLSKNKVPAKTQVKIANNSATSKAAIHKPLKNKPEPDKIKPIVKQQTISKKSENALFANNAINEETVNEAAEEPLHTDIRAVQKQNHQLTPKQLSEVTYQKGYQLLNQNKVYSAEAKLLLALEHDPKHIKAREMLTGLYLKLGRKVEAEDILNKGLLYLPAYSNFAKLYARLLLDTNQIEKAIKTLLHHRPLIKDDPDYFALLAASYQRQKKHGLAANTYVKLLKINPREGIWWVGMAISLEALGKKNEAHNAYEKARQTGTLNSRISKYSNQRLQFLQPAIDSE